MLVRFGPMREFDRVFGELRGRRPVRGVPLFGYRRDGAFVTEFDLPGVNPDSSSGRESHKIEITLNRTTPGEVETVTPSRSPWRPDDGR